MFFSPLLPISRFRDALSLLNKLSPQQIEALFLSHVVPASPTDSGTRAQVAREVGGAESVTKLISSLKQLIRDVSFFAASEEQVRQTLTSEVKGLSSQKAEALSKLCQDNISDWKRDQLDCGTEMLQHVDWNLKVIPCTSDTFLAEPRIQLQFQTDGKIVSVDADQQGMRSLYNKVEEVQLKLDQIAKSSLQKK